MDYFIGLFRLMVSEGKDKAIGYAFEKQSK